MGSLLMLFFFLIAGRRSRLGKIFVARLIAMGNDIGFCAWRVLFRLTTMGKKDLEV